MSKKDRDDAAPAPPTPQGPLGPWRLSIAVLVSLGFTGSALWNAATTGVAVDSSLLRSFGVAFITWIAIGRANKMLAVDPADETDTDDGSLDDAGQHDAGSGGLHPSTPA